MQLYFEANAVADAARLLTVIGAKTYETLRSLLAPERPRDKSCDEVKAILLRPAAVSHRRTFPILSEVGRIHRRFRRRPAATQHKVQVW